MPREFTVIDAPQRSPEWFTARSGLLTASDAKDALAFNKDGKESADRRDLRFRLLAERMTGEPQGSTYTNDDMARGVELEPAAIAAYEAHAGVFVDRIGFVRHNELAVGGSPDGAVDDFTGIVECKAPRPANHIRWMRQGGVPREHVAQCNHLAWITGAQWVDFVSYCPALKIPALQLYVVRHVPTAAELAKHETGVRNFLHELDLETASLQGWSILDAKVVA